MKREREGLSGQKKEKKKKKIVQSINRWELSKDASRECMTFDAKQPSLSFE